MKEHFLVKTINGKKYFLNWENKPVEDIELAKRHYFYEAKNKAGKIENTNVVERRNLENGVKYKEK